MKYLIIALVLFGCKSYPDNALDNNCTLDRPSLMGNYNIRFHEQAGTCGLVQFDLFSQNGNIPGCIGAPVLVATDNCEYQTSYNCATFNGFDTKWSFEGSLFSNHYPDELNGTVELKFEFGDRSCSSIFDVQYLRE